MKRPGVLEFENFSGVVEKAARHAAEISPTKLGQPRSRIPRLKFGVRLDVDTTDTGVPAERGNHQAAARTENPKALLEDPVRKLEIRKKQRGQNCVEALVSHGNMLPLSAQVEVRLGTPESQFAAPGQGGDALPGTSQRRIHVIEGHHPKALGPIRTCRERQGEASRARPEVRDSLTRFELQREEL